MRTSSKKYWAERSVELEAQTQTEAGKAADKIRKAYERAVQNINDDIEETFREFSRFTGVDEKLARELIDNAKNDSQYEELLFLLEETTDETQQGEIKKRINAQAYGARMSRLEALKQRVYIELQKAASIEQMIHKALQSEIMEISYYTTICDVAKGLNCGIDFSILGEKAIEKVLESDWLGSNYSSRIWKNSKQFVSTAQETIEDGIISGHSVDKMAERLKDFVNAEDGKSVRYVTERLVRTEAAHFMAEGQAAAYDEIGAQTYQFIASLSERTCEECGALDGSTFKLSEREPGANYPVIHPNCRCTTIIGDFLPKTRIAHDPLDGHKYKVDGSVTYEEWKNGLSDEQKEAMEQHVKKKPVDKTAKSDIIKMRGGRIMNINSIDSPIEQRNTGKGVPSAIIHADRPLNNRQKRLLESLPKYDSSVIIRKKEVNMKDLSALTAYTGDEFAVFTKANERLIIRGNHNSVNVDIEKAKELNKLGYRWSGHTHPGVSTDFATPSQGDRDILNCFAQKMSVIYNSTGKFRTFEKG